MKVESRYHLAFEDCFEDCVALVGAKSTGLGSMIRAGIPIPPGTVEGPARVILSADELADVQEGEIHVCPITNPSWGPVFSKIAAPVTDIGGMMSHASIVCREYGVPAVVGTGFATKKIQTDQRLRVDGAAGTARIID